MSLATIASAGVLGIDAYPIDVEVDVRFGLPSWTIVGLPEATVRESRNRVSAAIKNSGYSFENQKITINLSPAHIKKHGTAFDLPIAIGLMAASKLFEMEKAQESFFIGELCLDGRIKPVPGTLPISLMARALGRKHVVLPEDNAHEAAAVTGISLAPVRHIHQVVQALTGENPFPAYQASAEKPCAAIENRIDYHDIKGQLQARRAIEVAVAGGHNLLLIGPPGSGKTMLAERIPTILPPMTLDESLETTKIYSVVGKLNRQDPLIRTRPVRSPHSSISTAGLIGGGPIPKPGEVSFAHNGVLFLDELPEFQRHVIELLRQPLESGSVTIARALSTLTYPASFFLVAACNPCKCGYLGSTHRTCRCTLYDQVRYRNKISGPILDRIDLHIEVPALSYEEISRKQEGETSVSIAQRVLAARRLQYKRFGKRGPRCNARMQSRHLRQYCQLNSRSRRLLKQAVEGLGLSARSYDRILKVARTIADLADIDLIHEDHVAEAIQYRSLDREAQV